MSSLRNLQLPSDLCAAAEEKIRRTDFANLEEFLAFVLRELTERSSAKSEQQERKIIEERLRDLGYI